MQRTHAGAPNHGCLCCKQESVMNLRPCGHQVCLEHFRSENWRDGEHITTCPECCELVQSGEEIERNDTVISLPHPGDTIWTVRSAPDSTSNWPSLSNMFGNNNGSRKTGLQYSESEEHFPILRDTSYKSPLAIKPLNETQNLRTTQAGQSSQLQSAFAPMSPALPTQFGSNAGLNPNAPRYKPNQWSQQQDLDPIVRPMSSISNHTFTTQVAAPSPRNNQMPSRSLLNSRPPYLGQTKTWAPTHSQIDSISSVAGGVTLGQKLEQLGSELMRMDIDDVANQRPLPTSNEVDEIGFGLRNDYQYGPTKSSNDSSGSVPLSSPSSHLLANDIMSGATEDLRDKRMRRYDTPVKLQQPQIGPARFKDSKMFSIAETNLPDVETGDRDATPLKKYITPPPVPDWVSLAVRGLCRPSLEEALDGVPFLELGRQVSPGTGGVVRIKDIPYATTRQELVAFVGRNAQILRQPEGSPFHAVHIMMERETGKTLDCFIEFSTPKEALWVVKQMSRRADSKRQPKVGDREVEVVYSSQDELLAELFPRAKHVRFRGGQPHVDRTPRRYYEDQEAAGFQGFLHTEEFVMLNKHATLSDRSPFASKSPCRVYEHMVTTLHKYPWYALDVITVRERRAIFDTTSELIRILMDELRRSSGRNTPLDPNPHHLQELVVAALTCPGFSEKQKATIIVQLHQHGFFNIALGKGMNVRLGGHHEFSSSWPFASLGLVPGTDDTMVKYYAFLFRQATANSESASLAARMAAKASAGGYDGKPFGNVMINYGKNTDNLTLAEVAKIEYNVVQSLLQKACSDHHHQGPDAGAFGCFAPGRGHPSEPSSGSSSGAFSLR